VVFVALLKNEEKIPQRYRDQLQKELAAAQQKQMQEIPLSKPHPLCCAKSA
jgi:hypothetical protein